MKFICIGRNYAAHIAELENERPAEPLIFMKPATAYCAESIFSLPAFSKRIHYECEIVVRMGKDAREIVEAEVGAYFDAITLGIDFTARDVQDICKSKGLPWEMAKAWDGSAFIGEWRAIRERNLADVRFDFYKNGACVQVGHSAQMLWSIREFAAYASRYFTLKAGDVLFTGTPAGVGLVERGDCFEGVLDGESVLSCEAR